MFTESHEEDPSSDSLDSAPKALTIGDLKARGFELFIADDGVRYLVKMGDSIGIKDGQSMAVVPDEDIFIYVSNSPHSSPVVVEAYRLMEGQPVEVTDPGEMAWMARIVHARTTRKVTGDTLHRRTRKNRNAN